MTTASARLATAMAFLGAALFFFAAQTVRHALTAPAFEPAAFTVFFAAGVPSEVQGAIEARLLQELATRGLHDAWAARRLNVVLTADVGPVEAGRRPVRLEWVVRERGADKSIGTVTQANDLPPEVDVWWAVIERGGLPEAARGISQLLGDGK